MKIENILLERSGLVYYFAYGMLTDPDHMQGAKKVGAATIKNFEFELLRFANMVYKPGAISHGALWLISRDMLSYLDSVESYPVMYDRKTVPVQYVNNKIMAEMYILTKEYRQQFLKTEPDKSYLNNLYKGYDHFGLPTAQIDNALNIEK